MEKQIIFIKDTSLTGDSSREIQTQLLKTAREKGIEDLQVIRVADLGIYNKGIAIKIYPSEIIYVNVQSSDVERIIQTTIKEGTPIEDLLLKNPVFQTRIVLRNCGVIDPESIEDYISRRGYESVGKCLLEMTPETVIDEMKKSGLRGRGGAGFPTWMKWNLARGSFGTEKYVICNADEGDPGAYMDRSVLEGDPHSVIEGMIIAGYAIGATRGFAYVRAEYPLAIERMQNAINQAYQHNLLGKNILGSKITFDLEIRLGAGAFVCGEETALIASIEGKRGTPKPRPPYPSDRGLWDKPTIINNVETLANIPVIFQKGADWFASIGTEKSKGTKVFAVTGKIKHSGLVEIAMGTPLRDIVFGISGGVLSPERKMIAVQTGGPSGGVIPEKHFDTPVSYEHLIELGSIMGSGGMIVMDEDDCLVDISKFYLKFCVDESCGKCAPCRVGGYQMLTILNRISEGKGPMEDIATIKRIAQGMQKASLCALGQTAPNPVMSTLKYFENEYLDHIQKKTCRAKKCTKLLSFKIMSDKCKKCKLCVTNCPVNAISGDREKGYTIDQEKCIKCGRCFDVCKFEAIARA
ncbi:MAG TPA: NADH-ubiquinone oxidoreductase-F iron-sulfur binding region domain-containing protein [Chitinispirillaceae bacterium]|nr:NADH-ubiquinone oxidoreductase-F iron-sulfur binding region domain-containing protein [Chitinispirillaceae bacterium]